MHRIKVISYSGYIGEESPRVFFLGSARIEVVEILESWKEQKIKERSVKRYFKVKGDDGRVYRLSYDEEEKEWTCDPAG